MAIDATRALLDELMGRDRNLLPDEKTNTEMRFDDEQVCKYYICGFCPHNLFTNTKSDLGECKLLHDDLMKEQWEKFEHKERYTYESDFIRYLERLVGDLDKRIKRHHLRLDMQDAVPADSLNEQNKLRLATINAEMEVLVRKIEDLGEQGEVDDANDCNKKLDALKAEKAQLIRSSELRAVTSQEKKMRVCDICGAFLVINDVDKRTASHLDGKQHQGMCV